MPTSGVMVVARNKQVLKCLNAQFAARDVNKQYVAVVEGIVEQDSIEVNARISCDWPNRPRQHISDNGKLSKTKLEVISRNTALNCSLLKLKPITGRSHQLRVHMQYIGHPILGCEFYAPLQVRNRSTRLLLHAESITFTHPRHRALCHFYTQSTEIAEFYQQIDSPTIPDVSAGLTTASASTQSAATPSTTIASSSTAAAGYP